MCLALPLVGLLNRRFSLPEIDSVPLELFEPGRSLVRTFSELDVRSGDLMLTGYLETVPPALLEAIRAVLHSALSRVPRSLVTFAWAPAYDYELTVWDLAGTAKTPGGVTIMLRGPHAEDER